MFSEGMFWAYNSTHWENMPESALRKRVHKLDGTVYGNKKTLRVSKGFIDGTLKEMTAIVDMPGFFEARDEGVNLLNGFVRIEKAGNVCLEPHSPNHRQRFLISQEWVPYLSEVPPGNFQRLLSGSFGDEDDASHQLMLEVLGAAICGINTKLGSPKAFVLHGPSAANGKSTFQALIRELTTNFGGGLHRTRRPRRATVFSNFGRLPGQPHGRDIQFESYRDRSLQGYRHGGSRSGQGDLSRAVFFHTDGAAHILRQPPAQFFWRCR